MGALLGEQTRVHNDIDLFVEAENGERYVAVLRRSGFKEVRQSYTADYHSVWMDGRGRVIDLHLFDFVADGSILFAGNKYPPEVFGAVGRIAGKDVRCIPPKEQVLFHLGYDHDEDDRRDVIRLCRRFDIPVPEQYKK